MLSCQLHAIHSSSSLEIRLDYTFNQGLKPRNCDIFLPKLDIHSIDIQASRCYPIAESKTSTKQKGRIFMTYKITTDCIMCGACEAECPEGAISAGDTQYIIDPAKCKDCGSCAEVCPTGSCVPA